jgi:RNA recognition motif-containing protein
MSTRLLVDGIPSFFSDEQLRALFLRYGTVLSAAVMRYPNGDSLEFGYVEMAAPEHADRAISRLHRTQFYSQILSVKVDRSTPDEIPYDV